MSIRDTLTRMLTRGAAVTGVLDHADPRPSMGEIATTRDGRDITHGYVDALPLLSPTDHILLGRAGGDYQVYEQIQTDPQVQTGLAQRKNALVSREWEVLPGQRRGQYSKARAKQAADSLKAMLDDLGGESETDEGEQAQPMPGWDAISGAMLHGIFPGYGVGELLWSQDGREVVLDRVAVRRSRRFGFSPSGALRLMTMAAPQGETLPRRKFWSFTYHNDATDDPYGLGLAHWCYWPVYFKRADIRVWLTRLDKMGLPTVIGEYPTTASPAERSKLLAATRAVRSDSGLIIPQGMIMRLLEAASSGAVDYQALHDVMDAAISKVIVGHSAAADSTPGKLGGEDRVTTVADAVIKADSDLICGSFNVGPARWLTDWNFGPDVPAPKVWRRVEAEKDLKPLAERDQIIVDLAAAAGKRLSADYITETYDVELEDIPEAPPPPAPGGGVPGGAGILPALGAPDTPGVGDATPPGTADHADPTSPSAQALIDAEAAQDPGWDAAMTVLLRPILEALDQGLTPEEILSRLPEWYGAMDDSALIAILDQGVAAADALGRLDVQADARAQEGNQ